MAAVLIASIQTRVPHTTSVICTDSKTQALCTYDARRLCYVHMRCARAAWLLRRTLRRR